MTGQAAPGRWESFVERAANEFGFVLLLVLATYAVTSVAQFRGLSAVLVCAVGAFTAIFALASARARPRVLKLAAAIAVAELACAAIGAATSVLQWLGVAALLQMVLFAVAALALLRAVVTEESVRAGTIIGAVSVYVLLGLLFAFVYVGVDRIQSGDFFGAGANVDGGDYLFFSVTTLTTTGYGNLVPAGQPGKMLAAMEMLTGQIFVVTLVARLVSSWTPGAWLRRGAGLTSHHKHDDS